MFTRPATRGAAALGQAVKQLYSEGQTDYSLEPILVSEESGEPIGLIQDGDAVVFCCRRGEREIQLTEAFTDPSFDRFPRIPFRDLRFVILTLYHEKFKDLPVAFSPTEIKDTLATVIGRAGLRHLHTAESEKFAHVTFFFNGGTHRRFDGEQDICIPSPRNVPFDSVPELSLPRVTETVLAGIRDQYNFIVTNFANGDVIGHTANNTAKIQCASLVDARLGQLVDAGITNDYVLFITADHGNLEVMTHADGTPHVAHTANPVRLIVIDPRSARITGLRDGRLADIAPTVLEAMGLEKPTAMEGCSLAPGHDWGGSRRVLLLILDGWGIGPEDDSNPIFLAPTPRWDSLVCQQPHAQLQAAGEAVGLQPGKAGNSEAGHMNLGAGRVVLQDDVRLDRAMKDGSFFTNEVLVRTIQEAKRRKAALHLIGLLSERSSHGSIEYPLALLRIAKAAMLERVYIHIIFDGRSTEPGSAPELLEKFEHRLQAIGVGEIVSGMGRSIALDRNGNYEKTRLAYEALVSGVGRKVTRI